MIDIQFPLERNTLVFGPCGSGKTYHVARQAILSGAEEGRDLFIMTEDLTYLGVLDELSRHRYSVKVLSLALHPSAPELLCRYNPFSHIVTAEDVDLAASIIAAAANGKENNFLYPAAKAYLSASIALLILGKDDLSLPGLYRFIAQHGKALEDIACGSPHPEPSPFLEHAREMLARFKNLCGDCGEQVLVSCLVTLSPWYRDPVADGADMSDQMQLETFGNSRSRRAIVLEVCITDSSVNLLGQLLVFQAYRRCKRSVVKDVLFILDELEYLSPARITNDLMQIYTPNRSVTTLGTMRSCRLCSYKEVLDSWFDHSSAEMLYSYLYQHCELDSRTPGKRKPVKCVETGKVYPSISKAAQWLASTPDVKASAHSLAYSISQCAHGLQPSVHGTHWKFEQL